MSEFTLDRPDLFPSGTAIGLYDGGLVNRDGKPLIAPLQTKTAEAPATAVTFTELTTRNYVAGATVGGVWRQVRFAAGVLGASLKPPARYPSHTTH